MILVSDPGLQNKTIKDEITSAVNQVIDSGWYILGQEVEKFEKDFAFYCRTTRCVGLGNGTDAISLSLMALGIKAGDEVICPSLTATFTALAISAIGAVPVFADVDSSYTIDPEKIQDLVTSKTRAIIPVHLYGQPANMDRIMDIARKNNLYVIEDACQAHGALYKGRRVGSIGDIGCFSFYPTKNLGAIGDGGAITTNNESIYEKIRMLRHGGQKNRYLHELLGRNSRLDEIQAAVLSAKLTHLDTWNARRVAIANYYCKNIKNETISLPQFIPDTQSVFHLFVIKTEYRDKLMEYLKNNEIQSQIHYPIPAHQQPIYKENQPNLAMTEEFASRIVSLPVFPELTDDQLSRICTTINSFSI